MDPSKLPERKPHRYGYYAYIPSMVNAHACRDLCSTSGLFIPMVASSIKSYRVQRQSISRSPQEQKTNVAVFMIGTNRAMDTSDEDSDDDTNLSGVNGEKDDKVAAPLTPSGSGAASGLPDPTDPAAAVAMPSKFLETFKTGQESNSIPAPNPVTVSFELNGRTITMESGRLARQADGAVLVRDGNTMVLSTACCKSDTVEVADFMPLRVDYSEKLSAGGRTAGSYVKREGKPSEREVLVSRLIDRPLRPMFLDGYFQEVQLLSNVFSFDGVNMSDTWAICSCAAALHISTIPLVKAIAGVRIGRIDDKFIVNPTVAQIKDSLCDIMVAGTADAVLMIEGECRFLTEAQVLEAIKLAQESVAIICHAMDELRAKVGKPKNTEKLLLVNPELYDLVDKYAQGLDEALIVTKKEGREEAVEAIRKHVFGALDPTQEEKMQKPDESAQRSVLLRMAWKKVISDRMRRIILQTGVRPDGRKLTEVRPIWIDPGVLPMAHGSALFTRGETQALVVATLGGEDAAQKYESLMGDGARRFYLQYNFPPFSVGEVGRVGAPGRREVGHGKLAERALDPVIPPKDEFPYVIRVESNILESNGSSSMASVCGGCLALMNAGVPIKEPVAGIAMGLILDTKANQVTILSDILGIEDALGDMDFKVAGTGEGITSLQMDIKVEGITLQIMEKALQQAKQGRQHILAKMREVVPTVAESLAPTVPRIRTMAIPPTKIGDVIGPGGKKIRALVEECGGEDKITINIEQDGTVSFASFDESVIETAMNMVRGVVTDIIPGDLYKGKVTKVLPFGAYIELLPGKEGWLHISEVALTRVEKIEDVINEGDILEVKVIEKGRNANQFRVSRKVVLMEEQGITVLEESDVSGASSPSLSSEGSGSSSEGTPGENVIPILSADAGAVDGPQDRKPRFRRDRDSYGSRSGSDRRFSGPSAPRDKPSTD